MAHYENLLNENFKEKEIELINLKCTILFIIGLFIIGLFNPKQRNCETQVLYEVSM